MRTGSAAVSSANEASSVRSTARLRRKQRYRGSAALVWLWLRCSVGQTIVFGGLPGARQRTKTDRLPAKKQGSSSTGSGPVGTARATKRDLIGLGLPCRRGRLAAGLAFPSRSAFASRRLWLRGCSLPDRDRSKWSHRSALSAPW